jgi:CheY-like chemotaxis protein
MSLLVTRLNTNRVSAGQVWRKKHRWMKNWLAGGSSSHENEPGIPQAVPSVNPQNVGNEAPDIAQQVTADLPAVFGSADTKQEPRILIIDDELSMRRVCTFALRGEGLHAEAEGSPRQALQRLRAGERFDLLVLDYSMDELDGLAFLKELDASPECDRPAVVMASAHADGAVAMQAMALGVWDFLQKPLTPVDLRRSVHRILNRPAAAAQGDVRARALMALTRKSWDDAIREWDMANANEADLFVLGLAHQTQGDVTRAQACYSRVHWCTGWVNEGENIWPELARRLDV